MPFVGKLDPSNRWIRLSKLTPWERVEEIYLRSMSQETGHPAIPARIAFGMIYIKGSENCTGERCVDRKDEKDSDDGGSEPPKPGKCVKGRINPNTWKKKAKRQKKNRGKMLPDAAAAPADIKYPTDIDLLNRCREHWETAVNILWKHVPHKGHTLPYSAKKARKSYLRAAKSKRWTKKKVQKRDWRAAVIHRAGWR